MQYKWKAWENKLLFKIQYLLLKRPLKVLSRQNYVYFFRVSYLNQCEQVPLCCSQQEYSAHDGHQDQPHNQLQKYNLKEWKVT